MSKIIVNNLFVGSFGMDEANIPIEVINFFRDDRNDCYVYLAPRGQIGVEHAKEEVDAILFVRTAYTGVLEVIGKTGPIEESYVDGLTYRSDNGKKVRHMPEKQREAIEAIKYGGHSLKEIFSLNGAGESVFVSCKVRSMSVPKRPFFVAMNEEYAKRAMLQQNECIIMPADAKKINNQSMKVVCDEETGSEQYQALLAMINNSDLWEETDEKNQFVNEKDTIADDDNILKAMRQQDNEVIFSNLLYYFLSKYRGKFLQSFVREVLDSSAEITDDAIVQREKDRMDLSIVTDDTYIILENKIKSGINGVTTQGLSQEARGKVASQLSKYHAIAAKRNETEGKNREIECYILHPEYAHLELSYFADGNKYKHVGYRKLYDFFSDDDKAAERFLLQDNDLFYWKQFHNALYKHIQRTDCSFRHELLQRLKARIDQLDRKGGKQDESFIRT